MLSLLFPSSYSRLPDDPIDPKAQDTIEAASGAIKNHALWYSHPYDPEEQSKELFTPRDSTSKDKATIELVKTYIMHGQEVKTLEFEGSRKKILANSTVKYLGKYFNSLHKIKFNYFAISDDTLSHLKNIHTLQVLVVDNHHRISNRGIYHISNIINLTTLTLSNQGAFKKCKNVRVTNDGFKRFNQLVRLKHIKLVGFDKITLYCMISIMKCKKLKTVNFNECKNVVKDPLIPIHMKSKKNQIRIYIDKVLYI